MEILALLILGKPLWMWLVFLAFVSAILVFDLGVLHGKCHAIGVSESLKLTTAYVALGLAFSVWVWWLMGEASALAYLTGFVVEKSLAMDNIFVIAMIFGYFGIPREYQHKILVYGIIGVIVLRGIMIGLGASLVQEFDWILVFFALFLIVTGIKMMVTAEKAYEIADNPLLKIMRRRLNVTTSLHGERFFVKMREPGRRRASWFVTPLFLALVMVEIADVIFAVDSIPAIFAITTDPYIVYTSNIFAILGLRALFFALSEIMHRFHYMKYALSAILIFIGAKIVIADTLGIAKIPPSVSLTVTLLILSGGLAFSLWATRRTKRADGQIA